MAFSTYVLIPGDAANYDVPRIAMPNDLVAHVLNQFGGGVAPAPPTPPTRILVVLDPQTLLTT